ncbi:hypothetical protein WA158_004620 [Blastocystis sp. Blastoise]
MSEPNVHDDISPVSNPKQSREQFLNLIEKNKEKLHFVEQSIGIEKVNDLLPIHFIKVQEDQTEKQSLEDIINNKYNSLQPIFCIVEHLSCVVDELEDLASSKYFPTLYLLSSDYSLSKYSSNNNVSLQEDEFAKFILFFQELYDYIQRVYEIVIYILTQIHALYSIPPFSTIIRKNSLTPFFSLISRCVYILLSIDILIKASTSIKKLWKQYMQIFPYIDSNRYIKVSCSQSRLSRLKGILRVLEDRIINGKIFYDHLVYRCIHSLSSFLLLQLDSFLSLSSSTMSISPSFSSLAPSSLPLLISLYLFTIHFQHIIYPGKEDQNMSLFQKITAVQKYYPYITVYRDIEIDIKTLEKLYIEGNMSETIYIHKDIQLFTSICELNIKNKELYMNTLFDEITQWNDAFSTVMDTISVSVSQASLQSLQKVLIDSISLLQKLCVQYQYYRYIYIYEEKEQQEIIMENMNHCILMKYEIYSTIEQYKSNILLLLPLLYNYNLDSLYQKSQKISLKYTSIYTSLVKNKKEEDIPEEDRYLFSSTFEAFTMIKKLCSSPALSRSRLRLLFLAIQILQFLLHKSYFSSSLLSIYTTLSQLFNYFNIIHSYISTPLSVPSPREFDAQLFTHYFQSVTSGEFSILSLYLYIQRISDTFSALHSVPLSLLKPYQQYISCFLEDSISTFLLSSPYTTIMDYIRGDTNDIQDVYLSVQPFLNYPPLSAGNHVILLKAFLEKLLNVGIYTYLIDHQSNIQEIHTRIQSLSTHLSLSLLDSQIPAGNNELIELIQSLPNQMDSISRDYRFVLADNQFFPLNQQETKEILNSHLFCRYISQNGSGFLVQYIPHIYISIYSAVLRLFSLMQEIKNTDILYILEEYDIQNKSDFSIYINEGLPRIQSYFSHYSLDHGNPDILQSFLSIFTVIGSCIGLLNIIKVVYSTNNCKSLIQNFSFKTFLKRDQNDLLKQIKGDIHDFYLYLPLIILLSHESMQRESLFSSDYINDAPILGSIYVLLLTDQSSDNLIDIAIHHTIQKTLLLFNS